YGLLPQPPLALLDYQSDSQQDGQLSLQASLRIAGETRRLQSRGNGLLSAAASGLSGLLKQNFVIKDYHEHTLGERSDSRSVAYIRCVFPNGDSRWGVGIENDVARASLQALCNAMSAGHYPGERK
ncbi:2-isopropylmalate synthase, partial [Klebsiella michiganensis]